MMAETHALEHSLTYFRSRSDEVIHGISTGDDAGCHPWYQSNQTSDDDVIHGTRAVVMMSSMVPE